MTYIGQLAGVIFLAGWNAASVFLEYYLLWKVFQSVSALSKKVFDTERQGMENEESSIGEHSQDDGGASRENEDPTRGQTGTESLVPDVIIRTNRRSRKPSLYVRFKKRALTFQTGWHIYMRQTVARPGLSLAALYFTVISFGAITTGYAYTQGISESILSIVRGVGSLFGVIATFVFPVLRNRVGLVRSGLFSMSLQFSCLLFCVAAVFAPGSPFFLLPWNSGQTTITQNNSSQVLNNKSHFELVTSSPLYAGRFMAQRMNGTSINTTMYFLTEISSSIPLMTSTFPLANGNSTAKPTSALAALPFTNNTSVTRKTIKTVSATISPTKTSSILLHGSSIPSGCRNCRSHATEAPPARNHISHISIALLLTGIVTSRLGLWLSDLTITQLFQESVEEQERGIVGGMQSSFNSILSLIMFSLVIALPKTEHFGLLTLMSVSAVGVGALLYASFAYRVRGHLFHFDKVKSLCGGASSHRIPTHVSLDDLELEDKEAMIMGELSTRNENFSY